MWTRAVENAFLMCRNAGFELVTETGTVNSRFLVDLIFLYRNTLN